MTFVAKQKFRNSREYPVILFWESLLQISREFNFSGKFETLCAIDKNMLMTELFYYTIVEKKC